MTTIIEMVSREIAMIEDLMNVFGTIEAHLDDAETRQTEITDTTTTDAEAEAEAMSAILRERQTRSIRGQMWR
jgi:hypothetical protein